MKFVSLQSPFELVLDLQPPGCAQTELLIKDARLAFAFRFSFVECDIGVFHELIEVLAVFGAECDADTRENADLLFVYDQRRCKCGVNARGKIFGLARGLQPWLQQGELIAPDARDAFKARDGA